MTNLTRFEIETSEGIFAVSFSERGIARLEFPSDDRKRGSTPASKHKWITLTRVAVLARLTGREPNELPPLDFAVGTEFQQRVWSALGAIPLGQVWSYSELAEVVGAAKAARAVGNACGANPIPLLVPCHRVVPRGGGLGGFSSPLRWKEFLLKQEGVSRDQCLRQSQINLQLA